MTRAARLRSLVVAAIGLGACAGPARSPVPAPAPAPADPAAWVEQTLAGLSVEEKVGQLILPWTSGEFMNVEGPAFREVVRLIETYHVGGLTLGFGTPPEFATTLNALQARAKVPLLFSANLEYGPGARLRVPTYLPYTMHGSGGTVFPTKLGLGATADPAVAEAMGRITACEARAVGIHWAFAPVTDVVTDPTNPIINTRGIGGDAELVARLSAAFIRGAEAGGLLTTAKHFPGHGETGVDSHLGLPVLRLDRARLDSVELVPFRAAIAAGVSAVMPGHLAVPAITGREDTPGTLEPSMVTGLLREELGFRGLIVTDAMDMGGLKAVPGYSPGEAAVRAFEAGHDIILKSTDIDVAFRALVAAVRSGRIPMERLDASVRRVLEAKARLGLHRDRYVDVAKVNRIVGSPEHERVAAEAAAKSIVLARDAGGIVPLDPRRVRSLAVIAYTMPEDLHGGRTLFAELGRIYGDVATMRLHDDAADRLFDRAVEGAAQAEAVVLAISLLPREYRGDLRVSERAQALARRLAATGKPLVIISFGDPFGPAALPEATSYMLAWQPYGEYAQRAAARALAGLAPITGKLPVALPDVPLGGGLAREPLDFELALAAPGDVGMDAAALAAVDSIILAGIADGAAPGAALAVGRHGKLVRLAGYGRLDTRAGFGAVTDSTIWDLASLTKVIGTTTAAMLMVEAGRLDLDRRVAEYLPEWKGSPEKMAVTVRHLLRHNAGLPAFLPLYRDTRGREQYLARIGETELEYTPGTRTIYSDLGLILTGLIVERISGHTVDRLLAERVFGPLGMHDTGYNPMHWPAPPADAETWAPFAPVPPASPEPAGEPPALLARIAPTEVDTVFRMRHIHGVVHDENAYAIGGVSGHAGLFSSARDLARFAQMMLDGGFLEGRRILRPGTVARFTARQDSASSRALGWDTPSRMSSAGDYFSPVSFGHTGFTGTSIWVDPERDVFVVLLTNRVNPTRENMKVGAVRRAVADAVQRAIVDVPVSIRGDAAVE